MKIQIKSISQEGRRREYESSTNSRDITSAQNLIDLYLLSQNYRMGVGTVRVKPQGFGHGVPYSHVPFSARGILIDTCVYFNPKNDSSVLEVGFALEPKKLEGIVFEVMKSSKLSTSGWKIQDFGLIEVSESFPKDPDNICVRDIIERIKRVSGNTGQRNYAPTSN